MNTLIIDEYFFPLPLPNPLLYHLLDLLSLEDQIQELEKLNPELALLIKNRVT